MYTEKQESIGWRINDRLARFFRKFYRFGWAIRMKVDYGSIKPVRLTFVDRNDCSKFLFFSYYAFRVSYSYGWFKNRHTGSAILIDTVDFTSLVVVFNRKIPTEYYNDFGEFIGMGSTSNVLEGYIRKYVDDIPDNYMLIIH